MAHTWQITIQYYFQLKTAVEKIVLKYFNNL